MGTLAESNYVVLTEPCSKANDPNVVCLVGSLTTNESPHLITTRKTHGVPLPYKGAVLGLKFQEEHLIDYQVLDFDPNVTAKVISFYAEKHCDIIVKTDWSVPLLQKFYNLEQLVKLTSQEQETLLSLLEQQPIILVFQPFYELPYLSYTTYSDVCQHFGNLAESKDNVESAQFVLEQLTSLYNQNVIVQPNTLPLVSDEVLRLLERIGLQVKTSSHPLGDYTYYSWIYTERVASKITNLFTELSKGLSQVNKRIATFAKKSSSIVEQRLAALLKTRLVLLSTGSLPVYQYNLEIKGIIECAEQHSKIIDFALSYTAHAVEKICEQSHHLFLKNVHLLSLYALFGLLDLVAKSIDGIILYYDGNYMSSSTDFLNRWSSTMPHLPSDKCAIVSCMRDDYHSLGIKTTCYWKGYFTSTSLRSGYSLDFPVTWMNPKYLSRFIDLYQKYKDTSVIVVSTAKDYRTICELLPVVSVSREAEYIRLKDDPFGGLLTFKAYDYEDPTVLMAHPVAPEIDFTGNYYYHIRDTESMDLQCLGQFKHSVNHVFYYTSVPLEGSTLYRLVSHTNQNLILNCSFDLLPSIGGQMPSRIRDESPTRKPRS